MSLLAWPLTLIGLVAMYGWARWLLHNADDPPGAILIGTTTLALSGGALSLAMLWPGLLGLPVDWRIAALIAAPLALAGWIIWRRGQPRATHAQGHTAGARDPLRLIAWGVVIVICALIVFNAAYWPFSIDDSLSIYAWFGKHIARSGALPVGDLYETYPMAVPLLYAFSHQAAGWIDEGLARLIPALFAVGSIGAAYALGSALYDSGVGRLAALLMALAPMVTHWASTGYVDLPAGFGFGMSAVFLARLARSGGWRDALLAGLLAGLAAWIKNSGLLIVPSLALWLAYRWTIGGEPLRRVAGQGLLIGLGFAAVAGPWYARNLIMAGTLVPPTGWTWLAERTLANLFPYLVDSRYGLIGVAFTAGIVLTLWRALRTRGRALAPALLVILYAPFFAAWWTFVSYDGRFLLALTPLVAVMGASALRMAGAWQEGILGERWRAAIRAGIAVVIVALALPAASAALDFKGELLRDPFMPLEARHHLVLGDRYVMARRLTALPSGSRVWVSDVLLPYHADGVSVTVGGWPAPEQIAAYDYWVLNPGETLPAWFGDETPIAEAGGFRLYRVPPSS
jgi:hypothetical protein